MSSDAYSSCVGAQAEIRLGVGAYLVPAGKQFTGQSHRISLEAWETYGTSQLVGFEGYMCSRTNKLDAALLQGAFHSLLRAQSPESRIMIEAQSK